MRPREGPAVSTAGEAGVNHSRWLVGLEMNMDWTLLLL